MWLSARLQSLDVTKVVRALLADNVTVPSSLQQTFLECTGADGSFSVDELPGARRGFIAVRIINAKMITSITIVIRTSTIAIAVTHRVRLEIASPSPPA